MGERGIRVNAVAPGVVATGVVATDISSFAKTDAGRIFTLSRQALQRVAQPDDVGDVIVFLASDAARWITGDTIRVDGFVAWAAARDDRPPHPVCTRWRQDNR